jgi:hypothetical protein
MTAKVFRFYTKQFLAASLAVWLSGVAFLFCCETRKAQASGLEAENCPLAKAHNSCNKSANKHQSQFASIETERAILECCKMLPQIFDKARKIEKVQKAGQIAASAKVSRPKFLFVKYEFKRPKTFHSLVLNREDTYLKNCIFRI